MTIHTMKSTRFDDSTKEQWQESAIQSLKGKPFESLLTQTVEGIELQPLYTKDDLLKGIATARIPKEEIGWVVAQETFAEDGKQFVEMLRDSIERGNEAILIDGSRPMEWDDRSLFDLSQLLKEYPVYLFNCSSDNHILSIFERIPANERSFVNGVVSTQGWRMPIGYPNVRTVGADLWTAHQQGADVTTELALALARAAQYAENCTDFQTLASTFFVRFAVDTHFFMEIAKFRAFRILWNAFGRAYGQVAVPTVPVIATTSLRSYSKLDPYVNLLRAGNETFSAVLGGADVISVHPHDYLSNPSTSAIRFARNIQLVIKEETHADKVIDPAGGSYFIETLTAELVEKAWNLFLEIEELGGYDAFMTSGVLDEQLTMRTVEVATGQQSLIGTNVYAEILDSNQALSESVQVDGRLAEPFELVREYFGTNQPKTVLLTFGELKDFKPRADFVTGFLATGGIRSTTSPAFTDISAAMEWLSTEQPDYVIVCASPKVTEEVIEHVLELRSENFLLDVAGNYPPDKSQRWMDKGLDGFIYAGQNKVEKLSAIHTRWQGGKMR